MIEQWGDVLRPPGHGVTDVEYLDLEDLLGLVRDLNAGPVRDVWLLDSVTARPRSSAFGEDAYATLELKAAALLHFFARNHALVDGNKRLAWLATVVLLDLNGRAPELSHDAAYYLVMGTAEGDLGRRADRGASGPRTLRFRPSAGRLGKYDQLALPRVVVDGGASLG